MPEARTIVCAGGGTGGHIFPGIALATELQQRGLRVLWLGSRDALEHELVPKAGLQFCALPASRFRGVGVIARLRSLALLLPAYWRARAFLTRQEASIVVSLGGFAALAAALATIWSPTRLVILEQNSKPGWANRVVAAFADHIFTAFPNSFASSSKLQLCGNPLRAEFDRVAEPAQRYQQRRGPLRLLIMGGSQGAQALNTTVAQSYSLLPTELRAQLAIKHQCGRHLENTRARYGPVAADQVELAEFVADPLAWYLWADLIICRSGAMSVSELSAVGVAALLVPYPYAAGDHQYHNARWLSANDAAWLCPQPDFDAQWLLQLLERLLQDQGARAVLAQLARQAHAQGKRQAAAKIAQAIFVNLQP